MKDKNRLVFISGFQESQVSANSVMNDLISEKSFGFDDGEAITWKDFAKNPDKYKKVLNNATLLTHSMGATVLKHGNFVELPHEIHMIEAPKITTPVKYLISAVNYGQILKNKPELLESIELWQANHPGSEASDDDGWYIREQFREVARWFALRQFNRVSEANKMAHSRKLDGKIGMVALAAGEFDQYYPASEREEKFAKKLDIPYSVLAGATHDILHIDPAGAVSEHFRQVGRE